MTNYVTVPNFVKITRTAADFFKMAAAAILDFRNFKFLTVGTVHRVELRHVTQKLGQISKIRPEQI